MGRILEPYFRTVPANLLFALCKFYFSLGVPFSTPKILTSSPKIAPISYLIFTTKKLIYGCSAAHPKPIKKKPTAAVLTVALLPLIKTIHTPAATHYLPPPHPCRQNPRIHPPSPCTHHSSFSASLNPPQRP